VKEAREHLDGAGQRVHQQRVRARSLRQARQRALTKRRMLFDVDRFFELIAGDGVVGATQLEHRMRLVERRRLVRGHARHRQQRQQRQRGGAAHSQLRVQSELRASHD